MCWSGEDRPELCNHQLLQHWSKWDDSVPEDFEMNAITVSELDYLLALAKNQAVFAPPGMKEYNPKNIKSTTRFTFLVTEED